MKKFSVVSAVSALCLFSAAVAGTLSPIPMYVLAREEIPVMYEFPVRGELALYPYDATNPLLCATETYEINLLWQVGIAQDGNVRFELVSNDFFEYSGDGVGITISKSGSPHWKDVQLSTLLPDWYPSAAFSDSYESCYEYALLCPDGEFDDGTPPLNSFVFNGATFRWCYMLNCVASEGEQISVSIEPGTPIGYFETDHGIDIETDSKGAMYAYLRNGSLVSIDSDVVGVSIDGVTLCKQIGRDWVSTSALVYTNGDASGDTHLSVEDAVLFQRYLLGDAVEFSCWQAMDINHDGRLSAVDMTLLKRLFVRF